ncbi:carboxypeptidase regulatory-like domain-containing protein [Variovorax saccharolyticus]|uniref:carboxypeptidase regulatory-like domain-containing protein n=1 Tax=Variovorax saccharolyticus TaxID=3053516 RepID=UPI002577EB6E|nr:carboxypeptidase regulatory-like domain-containing protein [Variovorax sp. J22R187]MDM0021635.1 carboxypeptidase regulatory-like domain-containing protein [Variovorax sp. J22R187]
MALSTALLLSLAACGGGGGGSGGFLPTGGTGTNTGSAGTGAATGGDSGSTATATLSGIAATGAAFAGAKVTVVDQRGVTVCSTETDAKGAYECPLPAGTKAPLVVTATRDDQILYSTTASAAGGNVNVTPLTTIIVSRLSPNGDPASLAGAIATRPDVVTESTVKQQVAELVAALKPLLTLLGDALDPISGAFTADGSGHDRLLDSIAVSVRPDGSAANIEITVKSVPTNGEEPVSIAFRSDATLPVLPPEVATATLAPAGASLSVAALFARMEQCFALPLSRRVNAPNDTAAVTGGPSDVIAPECRTLFAGDDPASFRNNGATVGRNSNNQGAFAGLFRPGATGLKYDRGQLEFFRSNGDLVLSYRSVDSVGGVQNQTIVAKDVGGVLKLIGNQYRYVVNVAPTVQERDFLNASAFNYLSVSYDVSIPKQNDGGGNAIDHVVVKAPNGVSYTYKPQPGNANLQLERVDGNGTANTTLLRLGSGFRDAAKSGSPSLIEGSYFLAPQLSDDQLRLLPEQGVFTVDFSFVGGGTATQTHRMITRVPTIAEARQRQFAELSPTLREELKAEVASNQAIVFDAPNANEPSLIDFSAAGDTDGWTVPAGAPVPTALTVFGRSATSVAFEDRADFNGSARKAKIFCSTEAGGGDDHCTTINGNSLYAAGTRITLFQLSATDAQQVLYLKGFATYLPAN